MRAFFVDGVCMHYLSIDLEACNRYVKGSVFSIGVVEADENFNVLYKEDIIINPLCKFVTKFRKPIEFSVSKEEVATAPTLAEQYDKIKQLFDGDKIIMAHSANNDMFMLNEACKRARVPALRFEYVCTQMIYSAIYDVMNGIGLDKAAEELHLSFTHHKADDDALMALRLLQSCLEKMGCTYKELERKLGIKRGKIENYSFVPMRCARLEKLRKLHRQEKKLEQKQLQKELVSVNNIALNLDVKTYDSVRSGAHTVYTVNDELLQNLKVGDTLYLVKHDGHLEVTKVRVTEVQLWESFLELYLATDKDSPLVRNETQLDFLDRMYQIHDPDKEKEHGVIGITFDVLHSGS